MEWLPEGHLAYFVLDTVQTLDLSAIEDAIQAKDGRGERPYCPAMMVALLVYGYSIGVFSSRRLARATYEDVAFRVLAAGDHPHFTTVNQFRLEHREALGKLFVQVLRLCKKAGLVKLGHVAFDGTKVAANASKHKAMSYKRMQEEEKRLEAEVKALLAKADEADGSEDAQYGVGQSPEDVPDELQRREARLTRIREAKAALEQEAAEARAEELREQAQAHREKAADDTLAPDQRKGAATRAAKREEKARSLAGDDDAPPSGGSAVHDLPHHCIQTERDGSPKPKAQRNFTDPESRIMVKGGEFLQGYNAQVAVDAEAQVIVAVAVTNEPTDVGHLAPMLDAVTANCGATPTVATADSGYFSHENADACAARGVDAYVSVGRGEMPTAGPTTASDTPAQRARAAMAGRLASPAGKAIYARRKCIVEPAFGQIKQARGFRRFSFRGLAAVRAEWAFVCATHNLLKLFRSSQALAAA
jgi:transposase